MLVRRAAAALALVAVSSFGTPSAAADDVPSRSTSDLPGTTLEAEDRDDDTSTAPWLLGSAVAAAAAIAVGGAMLRRRMD